VPIKKANAETTNHSMLHILQVVNERVSDRTNLDNAQIRSYCSSPGHDEQDAIRAMQLKSEFVKKA